MYANQGAKIWYLCYHSSKIPAASFVHVDPPYDTESTSSQQLPRLDPSSTSMDHNSGISVNVRGYTPPNSGRSVSFQGQPRGNSTIIEPYQDGESDSSRKTFISPNSRESSKRNSKYQSDEYNGVGDMSHIPRVAPSRSTYTIPIIENNNDTIETIQDPGEDIFGMIKLKENDVCYTSGTIEWVGRKRSYPINSGFKVLNESYRHEPSVKKVRALDTTYTCNGGHTNDCTCADVLPTVNAIVDHLNALHEAVDLVDLRVNTLENAI